MENNNLSVRFCNAVKALANNEYVLDNLETYLSYHFPSWIEKYANTPDGLVSELEQFATITGN